MTAFLHLGRTSLAPDQSNGIAHPPAHDHCLSTKPAAAIDAQQQPACSVDSCVTALLSALGEDVQREGLLDTPKRVAKAWLDMTHGYQQDVASTAGTALFTEPSATPSTLIAVKNIHFSSVSRTTLFPFYGTLHIAYLPHDHVILGLSKFARIARCLAARVHTQESLATALLVEISRLLCCRGAAVVLDAHHCMAGSDTPVRGVTVAAVGGMLGDGGHQGIPVAAAAAAGGGSAAAPSSSCCLEEFLRYHVRAFDKDDALAHACAAALAATTTIPTTTTEPVVLASTSPLDAAVDGHHSPQRPLPPTPPRVFAAAQRLVSLLPVGSSGSGSRGSSGSGSRGSSGSNSAHVVGVQGYVQVLTWLTQGYTSAPLPLVLAPSSTTTRVATTRVAATTTTIPFTSLCEHHMLPFHGTVRMVVLTDPGRAPSPQDAAHIVHRRARRLQVQERLTNHIADDLVAACGGGGVHEHGAPGASTQPVRCAVLCEALHLCMAARGVGKHASRTVTTAVRGVEDGRGRLELLAMLEDGMV